MAHLSTDILGCYSIATLNTTKEDSEWNNMNDLSSKIGRAEYYENLYTDALKEAKKKEFPWLKKFIAKSIEFVQILKDEAWRLTKL